MTLMLFADVTPATHAMAWILGSIESFLVLVVVAIATAIYNSMVRKGGDDESTPSTPPTYPRVTRTPPVQPMISTARRPEPSILNPPAAPFVGRVFQPQLFEEAKGVMRTLLSHLDERVETDAEAPARKMMEYARQREETAAALSGTVTSELASVVPTAVVIKRGALPWGQRAVRDRELATALRDPASLRRLVLASAILGPPKALTPPELGF